VNSETVYVLVAVGAIAVAIVLYRRARYGSLDGALYGAHVSRVVGDVEFASANGKGRAKVCVLGTGPGDRAVGIELTVPGLARSHTFFISLPVAEARRIGELLISAARD
jgi:hypothetical protein